mgnify:FL=1
MSLSLGNSTGGKALRDLYHIDLEWRDDHKLIDLLCVFLEVGIDNPFKHIHALRRNDQEKMLKA